jgi:hypothetical protein
MGRRLATEARSSRPLILLITSATKVLIEFSTLCSLTCDVNCAVMLDWMAVTWPVTWPVTWSTSTMLADLSAERTVMLVLDPK